ncbi:hypothetical protein [Spiroplasma melliferum]|uniref:Uncharacterized protein n=2 Tax=Spiroplasma melliferum TaxID=2134 RepID=A0AAI9X0W6_SPIME|nr:hypothetical protein [Spiroplasma melliferum]ELL44130.1 hypothetical protein SMIPMB4A_v3c9540 [Spiroplasma melliferum IPMB4A]KAI92350.1 hypothetical protein SPM_006485 [Spiroplasma melliferum KC3]QCO23794.1 hypothetical protein SRED_002268 [Spiroplasma melliferum]
MRKIFLLFATASIGIASAAPITLRLHNSNNLPNTIFNSVHYNFHKDISAKKTNTLVEIGLFSYTQYSNNWNAFISHYQTLSFLNFDASAGGSGTTYSTNSFKINTDRLMTYSSIICHYIYSGQDVTISFSFKEINNYVFAIVEILATNNTDSNVWATLQLGSVIIY